MNNPECPYFQCALETVMIKEKTWKGRLLVLIAIFRVVVLVALVFNNPFVAHVWRYLLVVACISYIRC